MKDKTLNIVIIDDSTLDCYIAEQLFKHEGRFHTVTTFLQATEALPHISSLHDEDVHTIIIVDIQMPVMNGFEFLEQFEQLPDEVTQACTVYLIDSTVHHKDVLYATRFKSVRNFIAKPLHRAMLHEVVA